MTLTRPVRAAAFAVLAIASCLTSVVGGAAPSSALPAAPTITTTLTNSTSSMPTVPVVRYDTDGEAMDAHSSSIVPVQQLVNGTVRTTYYMYGESYRCGWTWQWSTATQRPFCGFTIYSSTDLRHWTHVGPAITDLTSPIPMFGDNSWQQVCDGGCFRPKVVYNATSQQYVMWVNVADSSMTHSGYAVLTSSSPAGPFVPANNPQLVGWLHQGDSNGDENVFVDSDGTAYVVYARIDPTNNHWLVVERLNTSYIDKETRPGLAAHSALMYQTDSRTFLPAGTEAPTLFKRGSTYYLVFGPTCPYCAGTPTYSMSTTSLMSGSWTTATRLNDTSCGGQPDAVVTLPGTTPAFLYVSDQWQGGVAGDHATQGTGNQADAPEYMAPLTFDSAGRIQPFACQASVTISGIYGATASNTPLPSGWQGSGLDEGFSATCDVYAGTQVIQNFDPQRTGTLTDVWISVLQRYRGSSGSVPNAPLKVLVMRAQPGEPTPTGPVLAERTFSPAQVGWSPGWVKLSNLNIPVTQKDVGSPGFDIVVESGATAGCYGVAVHDLYNDPSAPQVYLGGSAHAYVGTTWYDWIYQDYDFRTNL